MRLLAVLVLLGLTGVFAFVGAQKRVKPLNADLVVDLADMGGLRVGDDHVRGEIPFDQKQRHGGLQHFWCFVASGVKRFRLVIGRTYSSGVKRS